MAFIAISLLLNTATSAAWDVGIAISLYGNFLSNLWRANWIALGIQQLLLLMGGWGILGVNARGARGFSGVRLGTALLLTACFLCLAAGLISELSNIRLMVPRALQFVMEALNVLTSLAVLAQTALVTIGGGFVRRGTALLVTIGGLGICWLLSLGMSAIYTFMMPRFPFQLRLGGMTISWSQLIWSQLVLGGLDALFSLAAAVVLLRALRAITPHHRG